MQKTQASKVRLAPADADKRIGTKFDAKGNTAELVTVSHDVRTVEDALIKAEVDTDTWEVDRFVVNSWEVVGEKMGRQPLWQVKVWLKRRAPLDMLRQAEIIIESMRQHSPQYGTYRKPRPGKRRCMVELDIMDLHFGKRAWAPETGRDYDTQIAERDFRDAVSKLLAKAEVHRPERILMPIGNDLLHVDNDANTTTRGTRQDVDDRIAMLFRRAFDLLVWGIDACIAVAPVDVIVIPGNHEMVTMMHLGTTLAVQYRRTRRARIDAGPAVRKYYRYGATLLGFCHGGRDDPPAAKLPLIMANERPTDWAETKHHEWHIGHIHIRRQMNFVGEDTYNGVTVRVIPSLTGVDAWHFQHGFVGNRRSAEAYVWDYENGYTDKTVTYV